MQEKQEEQEKQEKQEKPAVPPEGARPPRRWRRRLGWFLGGLAFALLALLAVAPSLLSTGMGKAFIVDLVRERVAAPVEVDSVSFSWTGVQRVEGLRIGSAAGFPPEEDVLRLRAATVKGGLFRLFQGRNGPFHLELEEPVVTVHRSRGGAFNFVGLLAGKKQAEGGGAKQEGGPKRDDGGGPKKEEGPGAVELGAFPWTISVGVHGGRLEYLDDVLGTASRVSEIDGLMGTSPEKVTLSLTARAAGPGAAEAAGGEDNVTMDLVSKSLGDLAKGRQGVVGHVKIDRLDLRPYRGLLEKLAGIPPPDGPVTCELSASTRIGGAVDARGSLAVDDAHGKSQAEFAGSLRAGPDGSSWKLDLSSTVSIPAAAPILQRYIPEGLEIAPGALLGIPALTLEGKLGKDGALLAGSLDGKGRIEVAGGARFKGWTVDGLKADLRTSRGEVFLENVDAGVNGGRATARELAVDMKTSPASYHGSVRLEGVAVNYEMAELLAFVVPFLSLEDRQASFAGRLSADVECAGQGFARADLERGLRGKGAVRITDGQVSASPFFREAGKLIGADLERVVFSELGSDFGVGEGRVDARRVFLVAKEGGKLRNLGLNGFTRFDRTLEFGVDLEQLQETIGDRKIRRILGEASKVLGHGILPLKLKGTLLHPELVLEPRLESAPVIEKVKDIPVDEIFDLFKKKKKPKKEK